jgi:hypothetical protein
MNTSDKTPVEKQARPITERERLQKKLAAKGGAPTGPAITGMGGVDKKSIKEAIAESEARELDFDPSDRMKSVARLMEDVPRLKAAGKTQEEIKTELGPIYEEFPELFKKVYAGEDLGQLALMMKMMEHMDKRELTPHQASVIIGRHLANEYIPDHLKK